MAKRRITFGQAVAEARKARGMSQKVMASSILKEDGLPISAQYLNDIEHDRRHPPSERILDQMANLLGLPEEYLYFMAGQLPSAWRGQPYEPEHVKAAYRAFGKALRRKSGTK